MNNIRTAFALGIERKRQSLGLTQAAMARLTGLSLSSYKRIINGESELRGIEMLDRLYRHDKTFAFEIVDNDDFLLRMIKKLKQLDPPQLSFIEAIVDFEIENQPSAEVEITVITPTGDMEDGMLWDSCNVEKRKIKTRTDAAEGILITSNHLHPVYVKGDILLISNRPIRDGDTGIFINKDNNRAYLRKFHQTNPCKLEPVNNYGDTFYVNPDDPEDLNRWIKFGVVLTKVR